jgi:hypothetical protein
MADTETGIFFDPEKHMEIPASAQEALFAIRDHRVRYSEYLVYCTGTSGYIDGMMLAVQDVLKVYQLSELDLAKALAKHIREKQEKKLFSATENTREDAA